MVTFRKSLLVLAVCMELCVSIVLGYKPVFVAGATGYIGREVVKELVSREVPCVALVRSKENVNGKTLECLENAEIVQCNVLDPEETLRTYQQYSPEITISCLASRLGVRRDSWAVDYGGGVNLLRAQERVYETVGEETHHVLLSAFCCGKPLLQYQYAKLKLEDEIRGSEKVTYSIVRPTAYFKSLDGQVESARKGYPLLYFGSGSCSANAICEQELAKYLVDCALQPSQVGMLNSIRDVGGPDNPPIAKKDQINLIFDALNIPQEERRAISIPLGTLDFVRGTSEFLEKAADFLNQQEFRQRCEDAAELARIVKYYAVEPMVAIGEDEIQGSRTLADHFNRIAQRGGQLEEIDKMTTTTGVLEVFAKNKQLTDV